MKRRRTSTTLALVLVALACALCFAPASRRVAAVKEAKGGLKKSEAQKVIADLSLLALGKGAVVVKEITPGETSATVTADVRLGFHFVRDDAGKWHATEVRVGERQWEDFDLLARAAGADNIARARAALDSLAAELDELSRAKKQRDADKKKNDDGRAAATAKSEKRAKIGEGGDESDAKKKRKDKKRSGDGQAGSNQSNASATVTSGATITNGGATITNSGASAADEKELVRGALRVANPSTALSASGSSVVVEAEVEGVFDLVRDGGAWRVASVKLGDARLTDFDAVARTLDAEKSKLARADLDALANALEAFRRERGFYVVADSETVLMDFLHPRHIPRIIRIDPWHRPYEYEGTRDDFTLRSLGPDGKPDTQDDIDLHGHAGQKHSVGR
jgi:hypothetical protein